MTIENPPTPAPSLSLNDIAAVVQIIDICTKRGAFEGSELQTVGTLRGKFVEFVKAHKPEETETETSEEA